MGLILTSQHHCSQRAYLAQAPEAPAGNPPCLASGTHCSTHSCVLWGQWLNIPGPAFPPLWNGSYSAVQTTRWEVNKIILAKCLAQCLTPTKCSIRAHRDYFQVCVPSYARDSSGKVAKPNPVFPLTDFITAPRLYLCLWSSVEGSDSEHLSTRLPASSQLHDLLLMQWKNKKCRWHE